MKKIDPENIQRKLLPFFRLRRNQYWVFQMNGYPIAYNNLHACGRETKAKIMISTKMLLEAVTCELFGHVTFFHTILSLKIRHLFKKVKVPAKEEYFISS